MTLPAFGFSVTEAAEIVGVSIPEIYKPLNSGELSAVKVGRRTIITADALKRWLETRPAYATAKCRSPRRSVAQAAA